MLIQVLMVGLIIAFPGIVTGGLARRRRSISNKIQIEVPAEAIDAGRATSGGKSAEQEDAPKALERTWAAARKPRRSRTANRAG